MPKRYKKNGFYAALVSFTSCFLVVFKLFLATEKNGALSVFFSTHYLPNGKQITILVFDSPKTNYQIVIAPAPFQGCRG